MAILNPFSHAFGLDIGDRAFKLTQFMKRGKEYRLTAWGDIAVPEGVLDRGEIKDMDQAVALIGQLLRQTKGRLRGRAVVACLPEAKTFIKILSLPGDTENDKFKQAVLSEIELNIPLPADDIYYDWQEAVPLGAPQDAPAPAPAPKAAEPAPAADGKTPPKEEPKDDLPARPLPPKHLLLGAAPKSLVDSYTTMLEHAGLAPIALDIEAMAIARAIVPDTERDHGDPVGILDIGATRSSLVIYDAGSVQMSISIPISGIDITTVISDTLKVTMEDAELLKRECGLDANRCEDRMWTILLPLIDDMTMKIRNALRFFKIGFPEGKKIEKLYLCGGGAQFREIDAVLSRKLTIKVRKGDANANIGRSVPRGFPKDESLPYTTAIGLGLRAADENDKYRKRI